jgi:hypothetical protein
VSTILRISTHETDRLLSKREIADQLADMIKELEAEPEKYGYRTSTPWIGLGGDRTASQEILYIFYFNTLDDLHEFAHSPIHRIGWDY